MNPSSSALLDPLVVDVRPLSRLFETPALVVAHAAQQRFGRPDARCRRDPRAFDTQVAAGFVGYGTPSLSALLQGELGVTPAKGDRLTDWLRRPLTGAQKAYAESDVVWLLQLQDRLTAELE